MTSPAHRAALGFLRGGLVAAASLAIAPVAAAIFPSRWLAGMMQFLVPLAGFAFGGAIGGEALGLGSRGVMAFGCGGGAAGLVMLLAAPQLRGLTGFEDPRLVVSYAVVTSALAFGAMGLTGSLGVRCGSVGRVAAVFTGGGVVGGLLGVLPFLVQRWIGPVRPDLWVFVTMACSIGSVVVPLVLGGSSAARDRS